MSDLSARITDVQFKPVRLREGYDMGEVDAFLDHAAKAAAEGRSLEPLVAVARFTPVRMREGYDMAEVDAFLAEIVTGPDEVSQADAATIDENSEQHRLVSRITQVRFNPVLLREGYDMAEVDSLLDRLGAAANAGQPLAALCQAARFTPVRMREGYDQSEVDAFLAELSGAFPPQTTPPTTPRSAQPGAGMPDVIQEQRGVLSRLFGRG